MPDPAIAPAPSRHRGIHSPHGRRPQDSRPASGTARSLLLTSAVSRMIFNKNSPHNPFHGGAMPTGCCLWRKNGVQGTAAMLHRMADFSKDSSPGANTLCYPNLWKGFMDERSHDGPMRSCARAPTYNVATLSRPRPRLLSNSTVHAASPFQRGAVRALPAQGKIRCRCRQPRDPAAPKLKAPRQMHGMVAVRWIEGRTKGRCA